MTVALPISLEAPVTTIDFLKLINFTYVDVNTCV
jgi:hypothetical protein